MVQRHALKVGREGGDMKRELLQTTEIRRYLSPKEIEAIWGVKHHLTNVDFIFRRVFHCPACAESITFMRVKIFVSLKTGVLDPQGKAIERSLHTFGYNEVHDVRVGKYLELESGRGIRATTPRFEFAKCVISC